MKRFSSNTIITYAALFAMCAAVALSAVNRDIFRSVKPSQRAISIELRNSAEHTEKRQTYYIIQIKCGQSIVATAKDLAGSAKLIDGFKLTPDGHGLWGDVLASGGKLELVWQEEVFASADDPVILEVGRSLPGSWLEYRLNQGTWNKVDISSLGQSNSSLYIDMGTVQKPERRVRRYAKLLFYSIILFVSVIILAKLTTKLRVNKLIPDSPKNYGYYCAAIIACIVLGNLYVILADLLWYDDGFWYYLATSDIKRTVLSGWRGTSTRLSIYIDLFYLRFMSSLGIHGGRVIYTLLMGFTSTIIFIIYTNLLGLSKKTSIVAAILPHILPGIYGIPTSLNSSYALFGLLFGVLSIASHGASFNCDKQKKTTSSYCITIG